MITYNNGLTNSTVFKGKTSSLNQTTNTGYEFGELYTNGMQFRPLVDNENEVLESLHIFDHEHLLFRNYTDSKKVENGPNGIKIF